jgi:hypothetical protein
LNKHLKYRFDKLENEKARLMKSLAALPDEVLSRDPTVGQWSINQILMHLLTSEQLTLAYLKKKSQGLDLLADSGAFESLKMSILRISQRFTFLKYKAPEVLVANTPEAVGLPDLKSLWDKSRIDLRDFLENIQDKDLHKLVYKHPVAGLFNIIQCLIFLNEHFLHHLPQIKRLM